MSKPTKTSPNAHFWVVAGGHLVETQFIVKCFFQETKPHLFGRWTQWPVIIAMAMECVK